MFVVVARPARARVMLLVALMLGFAIALSAIFDAIAGHVQLVVEFIHIPALTGVATIWLLALPSRVKKPDQRIGVGLPQLRSVERHGDTA